METKWGRVKFGLGCAAVGALIWWFVGFLFFGWTLGGTAKKMVEEAVAIARTEERTPRCVERAKAPAEAKKLAAFMALKEAGPYEQRDFVADKEKGGWASFGGPEPDQSVAEACAAEILKPAAKKAAGK